MTRIGELYINGLDAFENWGVSLTDSSLTTLMEPEPLKDPVSNKSVSENGKQVRKEDTPKVDERDITLSLQMHAKDRSHLFSQLLAFKSELKKRRIEIRTRYEKDVIYRCDYTSCTQYKSFNRGIATFSLKLNEPNPANRGTEDTDNYADTDI
nr:hypothetical protein [uncultured Prevotella sp.]